MGLRGHSSLHGALDAAIETNRTDAAVAGWPVYKPKDGKEGARHGVRLRRIELGVDEDGDPITSCDAKHDAAGGEGSAARDVTRATRLPSNS